MTQKSFKNPQVATIWCPVHMIPGREAKQDSGSHPSPSGFPPMILYTACPQMDYGSWSDFLEAKCIFFFPFDLSQWYLYAWARWWENLLTFFFFFSWVPSKGNLKAQGTFMKNKCVCMCVNSVCVQIGILQETNSEVSKIIILLSCLYFLSLQEYEEIVAYHLLLRNG